ncbi:DUF6480 family protein [Kitasatospora sp. NBC_01302]|uniref:DUF6480 family protein n=1 Tax=Kitasatospora sp. NBC_01302 TaxID=2903575 RepID=UPI002E1489C2|nr:DUF6480 family protein [Kitasatospora sp. NBC_01302]
MAATDPVVAPGRRAATGAQPAETPECEASTCAGISTPEAVELHDAWPGWIPLLVIAAMVVSCAGFAVGRIFGW